MAEKITLSFKKKERLHHRSLIEGLYREGKSFYEFPFRVAWRRLSAEELEKNFRNRVPEDVDKVQFMTTVPKKKRRRAVDRVLMRRRIKEAYRLNKEALKVKVAEIPDHGTLSLGIVYIHDKNMDYSAVEEKIKIIMWKLQRKLFPQ